MIITLDILRMLQPNIYGGPMAMTNMNFGGTLGTLFHVNDTSKDHGILAMHSRLISVRHILCTTQFTHSVKHLAFWPIT